MSAADQEIGFQGRTFVELQQWIHDLRTPLSVIAMGVEALKSVRHHDGHFAELTQMILKDGIQPLNELLETLGTPETLKPTEH